MPLNQTQHPLRPPKVTSVVKGVEAEIEFDRHYFALQIARLR
jgi:hypothetical protein